MQRALCQGVELEDLGAKLIDAVLSSNSDRVKQLLDSQRNAVYRGIPEDMDSGACTPSKSFWNTRGRVCVYAKCQIGWIHMKPLFMFSAVIPGLEYILKRSESVHLHNLSLLHLCAMTVCTYWGYLYWTTCRNYVQTTNQTSTGPRTSHTPYETCARRG